MLSGCMENAFAGSKMTTFWVVSEGQPFWGGWWPHFLPLSLRQPYNQPVSSPCWRRPGSSPPWPSHRWSTASLEPGKGGLRSPSLQPTQAQSLHPEHLQRFIFTYALQWGKPVCLESVPRDSSYRNTGLPGSSSLSPVRHHLL